MGLDWNMVIMVKFNYTGHKALWDWLSKNPDKTKDDWEGWKYNGGQYEVPKSFCFACKYAYENNDGDDYCIRYCYRCPLVWPYDIKCGESILSLYQGWTSEPPILQLKSKLAAQIRDLPVRDGVEFI